MYIDYAEIDNDYDKRTMLVYYINVSLAMLNEFFWHVKNPIMESCDGQCILHV